MAAVRKVVGVMLHRGNQRSPFGLAHQISTKVQRGGGVGGEHHFVIGWVGTQKMEYRLADSIEQGRSLLRKVVVAAVDIGVVFLQKLAVGIQHRRWRVGACPVIQIDNGAFNAIRRGEALAGDWELTSNIIEFAHGDSTGRIACGKGSRQFARLAG